jgi:surface antigen/LysM repeat protein
MDPKDLLGQTMFKVYETQPGDTLSAVAKKFNLSTRNIQLSNNLPFNQPIKAGWFLILSTDPNVILHRTTAADSLPGLAKKYSVSEERIISYNGLEDAGDIDPDMILGIPGGSIPEEPKPQPKPGKPSPGKPIINSGAGNRFPYGQCTWYVASQVPWVRSSGLRGNARNWIANARALGATISSVPRVGDIASTPDSPYGHVAAVRAVYANGTMLLEDYNYSGKRQHGTHIERISRANGFIRVP